MSNIQKQHKISPAIAWLTIQKFIIFYCPLDGEHTSGYVFCPGAFLSVKTKMTIYKSISPSFYEGGDSEWFINYPSFIIKGICEQSVSKF